MFRNRRNSQKPDDELIQKFKRTFSDVMPGAADSNISADQGSTEIVDQSRPHSNFNDLKSNEQTRRSTPDPRLSSPFIDPNSLNFLPFTNQPHSLFTPNSIGFNGNFHSQQAGDLHTPTGLNMMTPLSFSNQLASTAPMDADATAMGINQFGQQFFSSPFQNTQSFAQQPSFAPSAFHHDAAYDAMDESVENSSPNELELQDPSTMMPASTVGMANQGDYKNGESEFRYNATLRAPTAMIRSPRDIPITYLNKGQAYSLSVVDSTPPLMDSKMLRYRTFVRVTFQDKEQRVKPGACWQLWKEGRGSSEAHQRHGKVQAVEYVDPFQGGNEDRKGRQVQVESSSIDGFCVTWTANPNTGASECTIPVRFNFLSTDFSHSKGVKGIPVRLCAKTQLVSNVDGADTHQEAELNFCQVKLFRDHGAERKLSNDVAHVKKTIEKLKQQIAQAEMGGGNNGKRKRTNASVAFNGADHRPPKISKHKRTWSMDSRDADDKVSLEDDLHDKLAVMQEMFSSTCPTSSLNMPGDKQDDPDLSPVQLPRDDAKNSSKKPGLQALRGTQPSFDAPVPSSVNSSPRPFTSQQTNTDSGYQTSLSSRSNSLPGSDFSLSHPVKVQRINSESNPSTGYLEAVDIDPTYRPPEERRIKPIACFYLRFPPNEAQKDDYYRAVYLSERSVRDLMDKISIKRSIDSKRVLRVLLVKKDGLKVMVDDDVVRELPDGQNMDVEISETTDSSESPDDSRPSAIEVKLTY